MGQGFHFKAPWDRVVAYEVRQKESQQKLTVLSSNLLKIELDMTVFHQPVYDLLGALEVERGRGYEENVIVPSMRSVSREVISKYLPEEINTSKREQIQGRNPGPPRREAGRQLHSAQRRAHPQHPPAPDPRRSH